MKKLNIKISDEVHNEIPGEIRLIVARHLTFNEENLCEHNRSVLDDIIADLKQYASTLPSVQDLESVNAL